MDSSTPLFAPNNHSAWQISYHPVDEQHAQHLKEIVRKHYSFSSSSILSVERSNEAEVNSNNFKVTVEQEEKNALLLLRRMPASRTRAEIERTCDCLHALSMRGIKVPHILPSRNGKRIVEGENEFFVLFDFISGDHYRGTWKEMVDVGAVIGALDTALLAMSPLYHNDAVLRSGEASKKVREFSVPIWKTIFAKANTRAQKEGEESIGARLLKRRDEIIAAVVERTKAQATDFQFAHVDLHPHNVLANGTAILAILDFDSVRYVEKMRAVAFAIHRLVRQYIVYTSPEDIETAVKRAKVAFLEAYRSQNTLSREEELTIPYFIKDESLSRLTRVMKEYVDTGNIVWQDTLEKQLSNIQEAHFFL